MGELVDALVRVLEFMVQGALAVLLGAYILAWVHKFKNWVYEHAGELAEYMLGPRRSDWRVHPYVFMAIALGCLYLIGVVTNAVGYWVLRPAHETVIAAAVKTSSGDQVRVVAAHELIGVVAKRAFFGTNRPEETHYVTYLKDEVLWRNRNLEAMKHALDPLVKQNRVIRGTAVISFAFFVFSLLKVLSFLGAMTVMTTERWYSFGRKLYMNLVDPKADIPVDPISPEERTLRIGEMRRTTGRYAVANLIYSVIALVILWSSIGAYATLEREYHVMAHYGPLSAEQKAAVTSGK